MAFSDLRYLLFLGFVALLLPAIPRGSPRLLTIGLISLGFYAGLNPGFWYVLVGVGLLAYLGGLALSGLAEGRMRAAIFVALLFGTLLPLLTFKYAAGLYQMLAPAGDLAGPWSTIAGLALPVGISFYSFLAAGYLIDVYVGTVAAERDAIRFSAFFCFFPHLTAGPIERARHLLPQMENIGQFDYDRAVSGLRAILMGLFLKRVIADTLAPNVESVYSDPHGHGALDLGLATIYFSFQVYADFAGYSLIAIGSARLLGVELLTNFKQPWLSQNLPDFWRRWHISLSSWFRDYVFTPLQFQSRRWGVYGLSAALIFTFMLVGIWHGAGLNFALFGLIHGALVAFSTLTFARRDKYWRSLGVPQPVLWVGRAVSTFLIVSLTFVMFRAGSVGDALWIYEALIGGASGPRTVGVIKPAIVISVLVAYDLIAWSRDLPTSPLQSRWASYPLPWWLRWAGYYAVTACIIMAEGDRVLGDTTNVQQFIYFKF
jgi:D-alanyl-lipoteichoic acid acyltransferase DltB (MBOAT superfamily)